MTQTVISHPYGEGATAGLIALGSSSLSSQATSGHLLLMALSYLLNPDIYAQEGQYELPGASSGNHDMDA